MAFRRKPAAVVEGPIGEGSLNLPADCDRTKLAADKRYAPKILPAVAKSMIGDTHVAHLSTAGKLFGAVRGADPEVQKLAVKVLAETYAAYPMPDKIHASDKISMEGAADYLVGLIGGYTVPLQGGADAIYAVSKKRYPGETLPHGKIYHKQDPSKMSAELKAALEDFRKSQRK